MIPVNMAAGKAFHDITQPGATGEVVPPREATRDVQSSVRECPGWALAHGALQYPMAKAVEIIESMTVARPSAFALEDVRAHGPEKERVGQLIKAECDNPNPSRDYTRLQWVCPQGDRECPQKQSFAKKYEEILRTGVRDGPVIGLAKLATLLEQQKTLFHAEDETN